MRNNGVNKRGWLWLIALLALFLAGSYFISSKHPKEYPPFDSNSPSPSGTKAFFTYLEEETDAVKRWRESPLKLPKSMDSQLFIMVEPIVVPESEEMEAYINFMEAGNRIVLLKLNPSGYFNIRTTHVPIQNSTASIYDLTGKSYIADIFSQVRMEAGPNDEVLLKDDLGVIALKKEYGAGSLIVANSPGWIKNEQILLKDHLPLILSILQESATAAVYFDEYTHGDPSNSGISVYQDWFILLLLQGGFLSLFILWLNGKRFGPVLQAREESVRFSDESLRALAAWHIRGKNYHYSLSIQAEYVKHLLQERWGIPYNKEWKDCAGVLYKKWKSKDNSDIDIFLLQLTQQLNKEKVTKQEYLLWSTKLDTLRKEVEEG